MPLSSSYYLVKNTKYYELDWYANKNNYFTRELESQLTAITVYDCITNLLSSSL